MSLNSPVMRHILSIRVAHLWSPREGQSEKEIILIEIGQTIHSIKTLNNYFQRFKLKEQRSSNVVVKYSGRHNSDWDDFYMIDLLVKFYKRTA